MSQTSTLPQVKARMVTLFTAALATANKDSGPVPVTYAWPGSDGEAEAVYLGRHPDFVANPLAASRDITSGLATIKAGRKSRDEVYDVEATVWSFRPELDPNSAATAEAQGFAILARLEDVLADDPKIGLTTIQHAVLGDVGVAVIPFQKGWASVLIPTITVTARLT